MIKAETMHMGTGVDSGRGFELRSYGVLEYRSTASALAWMGELMDGERMDGRENGFGTRKSSLTMVERGFDWSAS